MFETTDEIMEQLLAGEDSFAEFKEVRFGKHGIISPNTEDIAGEMTAFANAEGGAIFLGVNDSGEVLGVSGQELKKTEEWIDNISTNNCNPPIIPGIRKVRIPGISGELKTILVVNIKRGIYAHQTSGGRWYIRVGSRKRDLTGPELSRLMQERGRGFVFDENPVFTATADELDPEILRESLGDAKGIDATQLLLNKNILIDDNGILRPTVAGLLCFSKKPQNHLKNAFIHAALYRGSKRHSNDLSHSENITGPVQKQIDGAVDFVDRLMLRPAKKDIGRNEYPQYLLGVVQEAIVNAVAHRDYSISGSKIRLFMYRDRLELLSPGGLPNTLTLESMRYRQFTRNQLLVSFLSKMRSRREDTGENSLFIEERGEGVARIIDESLEWSGKTPVYETYDQELSLTLFAKPIP